MNPPLTIVGKSSFEKGDDPIKHTITVYTDFSSTLGYEEDWIRRVIRKVDLRILPVISIAYMLCFVDRVNIGFARSHSIESDLKITPEQYSWCLSVFFIGYILFELPSNLMLTRSTPSKWISKMMVFWGVVMLCTIAVTGFQGLFTARFFLGLAEAGLFPGLVYFLCFWYTRFEQGFRIAVMFNAGMLGSAFAGPIAYGIGYLDSVAKLRAWKWVFLVEGVCTVVFGIAVWWLLPNGINNSRWLTIQERKFLQARIISDFANPRTVKFQSKQFKEALTDYKVYLYGISYFGVAVPFFAMAQLLPTILRAIGFEKLDSMLMAAPPYGAALLFNLFIAWNSDRVKERTLHCTLPLILGGAGFFILFLMTDQWSQYIACFLAIVGTASVIPIQLAWLNNNMHGSTKAGTASAVVISMGNVGGMVASQMYNHWEAPNYTTSHLVCMVLILLSLVTNILLRILLNRENRLAKNVKLTPSEIVIDIEPLPPTTEMTTNVVKLDYVL